MPVVRNKSTIAVRGWFQATGHNNSNSFCTFLFPWILPVVYWHSISHTWQSTAWFWRPDWFQRRQPSSSSHPEEDGGRQGMMTCLLSQHRTAWANLCSGELLPVLCPIGFGRNQQCHRMTEVYFFFSLFSSHVQTTLISVQALPLATANFCIFDVNIWFSLWYYKWPIWFLSGLLKFIHYALSHPRQCG